jgi:DNA-directed RNA polymerase specialized sigma24 family protein
MTADRIDLRREILGLESSLVIQASRMARDDDEARELVQFTLRAALESESGPPEACETGRWLRGLMRGAFHSVARRRATRERAASNGPWRADRAEVFVEAAKARLG